MKGTVVVRDNFSLTRAWICHVCRMIITWAIASMANATTTSSKTMMLEERAKLAPARSGGTVAILSSCENQ